MNKPLHMKSMMSCIIDCGVKMGERSPEGSSTDRCKLDLAKDIISDLVLERMTNTKTMEFAINGYGCDVTSNHLHTAGENGYDNIYEAFPMSRVHKNIIEKIESLPVGKSDGDIVAAMVLGFNQLYNNNEKLVSIYWLLI